MYDNKMMQEFMVYNHSGSKIVISTKDSEYLFESGSVKEPYGISLRLEEIVSANMKGDAFKNGWLTFDSDDEEYIYSVLKILDWKNILKNWEIEDILLHPTKIGLEKIVKINNTQYFERVIGVMTGLNSAFYDIPTLSNIVVKAREDELKNGHKKSDIKIENIISKDTVLSLNEINAELTERNEQLINENSNLKSMLSNKAIEIKNQSEMIMQLQAKINELSSKKTQPRKTTAKQTNE